MNNGLCGAHSFVPFAWVGPLCLYVLSTLSCRYKNLQRWTAKIAERSAVRRGKTVNKSWGGENENLKERHSRADFKVHKRDTFSFQRWITLLRTSFPAAFLSDTSFTLSDHRPS